MIICPAPLLSTSSSVNTTFISNIHGYFTSNITSNIASNINDYINTDVDNVDNDLKSNVSTLVSLFTSDTHVPKDASLLIAYENCVIPCPSITYSHKEWDFISTIITVLVIVSFVLCLINLLSHISEFFKYYIRVMFICGFLANSTVIMLFVLWNDKNQLICYDNMYYLETAPLCLFQASATIWSFMWTNTWSVILSYDTLLQVTSLTKPGNVQRSRRAYTLIAIVISTLAVIIPLLNNNLGFDPEANIPICLFLVSKDPTFFWVAFVIPFYVLLISSMVLTIMCAYRVHLVFISSSHYQRVGGRVIDTLSPSINRGALIDQDNDMRKPLLTTSSADSHHGYSVRDRSVDRRNRVWGSADIARGITPDIPSRPSDIEPSGNSPDPNRNVSFDMNFSFSYGGEALASTSFTEKITDAVGSQLESVPQIVDIDPSQIDSSLVENGGIAKLKSFDDQYEPVAIHDCDLGDGTGTGIKIANDVNVELFPNDSMSVEEAAIVNPMNSYGYSEFRGTGRTPSVADSTRFGYRVNQENGFFNWFKRMIAGSAHRHGIGIGDSSTGDFSYASSERSVAPNTTPAVKGHQAGLGQQDAADFNGPTYEDRNIGLFGWICCCLCCIPQAYEAIGGHKNASSEMNAPGRNTDQSNSRSNQALGKIFRDKQIQNAKLLSAIWHYNGRSIMFMIAFCLTTILIFPVDFNLYYVQFDRFHDSRNEFVDCLVNASITCANQTQAGVDACAEVCGSSPAIKPDIAELLVVLGYAAAYGIIPAVIYGFSGQYCMKCSYGALDCFLPFYGASSSTKSSNRGQSSSESSFTNTNISTLHPFRHETSDS